MLSLVFQAYIWLNIGSSQGEVVNIASYAKTLSWISTLIWVSRAIPDLPLRSFTVPNFPLLFSLRYHLSLPLGLLFGH